MIVLEGLKGKLSQFENLIDYQFKDKSNLILALTHSSYANEFKDEKLTSNERIEFLGDSILNLIISEYIYFKYPKLSEGEMTRARAAIVCEQSLVRCSNNIGIGNYLLLGKGEELTGGRTRISILSDAFEAVIGAIYTDGGMEKAKLFVMSQMKHLIEDSMNGVVFMDYKTQLQEKIQKFSDHKIQYEILEEKGPDHNKIFVSQVKVSDEIMGTGEGRSKKEAEQSAAKSALEKYGDSSEN
ncbi:MAG: ribonuclease III [Clostridia bacterium]|nr:ribonuclease III [Clostridia bacterium]